MASQVVNGAWFSSPGRARFADPADLPAERGGDIYWNQSRTKSVLVDMEVLMALAVLVLLDVAALIWGADSRIWADDTRAISRRPRRAF